MYEINFEVNAILLPNDQSFAANPMQNVAEQLYNVTVNNNTELPTQGYSSTWGTPYIHSFIYRPFFDSG